jgi:hypothetical protein
MSTKNGFFNLYINNKYSKSSMILFFVDLVVVRLDVVAARLDVVVA